MNRFFYYLLLINMITSVVATNPKVLLHNSDKGAITSMILAVVAGLFFVYIVAKFFNKFPGQGLPELLYEHTPKWFSWPVILYLSVNFYILGLITLVTYSQILRIFLSPQMSIYIIVLSFVLFVSLGILMKTRSVLYSVEFVLILFVPIFLFIFIKAYTEKNFDWDTVRIAMMHINNPPEWTSFTTAAFIFLGPVNLILFNRVFKEKQTFTSKSLLTVGGIGIVILFTLYFVPIGFGGFDRIGDLVFPWISATDSMRMKYGLVERVIFVFMVFFLGVALLSIIIHWHVAFHLIDSLVPRKTGQDQQFRVSSYSILILFWIIGFFVATRLSIHQVYRYISAFDNVLPLFAGILFLSFFVVKRGVQSK